MGGFEGNLWAGAKATFGLFIDEQADEQQREALQMIGGQAGGWPADFAETIAEMRGVEFAVVDDEDAREMVWDLVYGQAKCTYQSTYHRGELP